LPKSKAASRWLDTLSKTAQAAFPHRSDGPGGIAAIALLVSVGMIAYQRYKRKQ
jgi:hypothetical protein